VAVIDEFVRALQMRLREEAALEKDSLARGTAADLGEYKYSCGVIRGFELVEQYVRDMMSAYEDNERL
jgi:hypothetical protein